MEVWLIRRRMVGLLSKGCPAQCLLISLKRRCSIGFHFGGPGGIMTDADGQAEGLHHLPVQLVLPRPYSRPIAPADQVFDTLGADPPYRRLCRTQKCFLARLTPKPWRCGVAKPPVPVALA